MTTRWSLLRASVEGPNAEETRRAALEHLCRIYWRSVLSYVQSQGHGINEAEDLTQDFFLHIMGNDFFERANPNEGRFRAWLLQSLKNFLNGALIAKSALKRGGKRTIVSLEQWMGESPSTFAAPENMTGKWSPDVAFDVHWAAALLERGLSQLQKECQEKGRERVYHELKPYMQSMAEKGDYEQSADVLGLKTEAVRVLISRLRKRLGELLREEVLETVADESEVDGEMRYLCELLGLAAN